MGKWHENKKQTRLAHDSENRGDRAPDCVF